MLKTQSAQTLEQVFLHTRISIIFNCGFWFQSCDLNLNFKDGVLWWNDSDGILFGSSLLLLSMHHSEILRQ